jgi:uncharacterized SAM-binding protein YcdF (DUF218 family)
LALFCVFILEASYFSYILALKNSDVPSDAILIFTGSEKRIETGYELANLGLAPCIVLSSATDVFRRYCDKQYALKDSVTHIPEDHATNTFENALYTSRIIKAHQFKNIILVTSDYHMPRSLALLRLLADKDVRIHIHAVHGAANAAVVNTILLKLVYNEMVEFWGSLFEYVSYQIAGAPAEKPMKKSALSLYLRSLVLLDAGRPW